MFTAPSGDPRDFLRLMVEGVETDLKSAELLLTERARSLKKSYAHGQMQAIVALDAWIRSVYYDMDPGEPMPPHSVQFRSYRDIRIGFFGRNATEWRRQIESEMVLIGKHWYPAEPGTTADFDYRWSVAPDCIVLDYFDDATREWTTVQEIFGTMDSLLDYVAKRRAERDRAVA